MAFKNNKGAEASFGKFYKKTNFAQDKANFKRDEKAYKEFNKSNKSDDDFVDPNSFFNKKGDKKSFGDKKTFEKKSFGDKKPFEKKSFGGEKSFGDKKPFEKKSFGDKKPFDKKPFGKPARPEKEEKVKIFDNAFRPKREKRPDDVEPIVRPDKVYAELSDDRAPQQLPRKKKEFTKKEQGDYKIFTPEERKKHKFLNKFDKKESVEKVYDSYGSKKATGSLAVEKFNVNKDADADEAGMPLNKFIAHAGVCSRRDAVGLIKAGEIVVNGVAIKEPGFKVSDADEVTHNGKLLKLQKEYIYVLLNKPKGFITTTDDPKGRRTVMDIFGDNLTDRVFPVGRLDRATTGLLLLTNDGELAQKLSHPKYGIRKIYQVTTDKNVTKTDFEKILAGVVLEDGVAPVDQLAYLENKNEIGIEIHNGKNRIVRRIFESLNYEVEKLDRVMYAGLTKKNLKRGQWRFLTKQEVINLKFLSK